MHPEAPKRFSRKWLTPFLAFAKIRFDGMTMNVPASEDSYKESRNVEAFGLVVKKSMQQDFGDGIVGMLDTMKP